MFLTSWANRSITYSVHFVFFSEFSLTLLNKIDQPFFTTRYFLKLRSIISGEWLNAMDVKSGTTRTVQTYLRRFSRKAMRQSNGTVLVAKIRESVVNIIVVCKVSEPAMFKKLPTFYS